MSEENETDVCKCEEQLEKKRKSIAEEERIKFLINYKVPSFPPCDIANCSNAPKDNPCPKKGHRLCKNCGLKTVETCEEILRKSKRIVIKPDQPVMICECRPSDQKIKTTTREDVGGYDDPPCPPCPPRWPLIKCGCPKNRKIPEDEHLCGDENEQKYGICNSWIVYKDCFCEQF